MICGVCSYYVQPSSGRWSRHKSAEFVAGDGKNSNWSHKNAGFVAGKGKNLTGKKLTGGELKGRKSDRNLS